MSLESEKSLEPQATRPWYVHDGDWWTEIVLVIIGGLLLEAYLQKKDFFLALRYQGYSAVQHVIPRIRTPKPRTAVLLVDDADYWKAGDDFPGGRSPIPRTYLASLVSKVANLNPKVIALDFDLRTAHQQAQPDDGSPSKDVLALTHEINRLSSDPNASRIVLAKSLWKKDGAYIRGLDIYDGLVNSRQIDTGFIALPHQTWRMPFPVRTEDAAEPLRPFSLQAADALNAREGKGPTSLPPGRVPFAPYRDVSEWVGHGKAALLAGDDPKTSGSNICNLEVDNRCRTVLASYFRDHASDPAIQKLFRDNIVLIGGDWHTRAEGQGDRADRYLTPAGDIPGVLIHASYIEGFRTYALNAPTRFGEYAIRFLDFWLSLGFALLLASFERRPRRVRLERFRITLTKIFTAVLFIFLVYVAGGITSRLGYFFDFTIVAITVAAHYAYDSVEWPWRKEEMDRDYTLLGIRALRRGIVAVANRLRLAFRPTAPPVATVPRDDAKPRIMQVGAVANAPADSLDKQLKTGTK